MDLISLCSGVKQASTALLEISEEKINLSLKLSAKLLRDNKEFLKEQNKIDMINGEKNGKSASFLDRLLLSDSVIESIATGILQVATLTSPVGKIVYDYQNQTQGISIQKKYVPFGVVGMIYEARPNVTADAFSLCFKTRNAVILKGGSDAINSNKAIVKIIREALKQVGIDERVVTLIEDTSRETTKEFMQMNKFVDLLIPRGSASLINSALENSTIPIIETGTGNCHAYIDESANLEKAVNIIFNAKTQRYSVCNALESIVINSKVLDKILPSVYSKLREKQVEMRVDERAFETLKGLDGVVLAEKEDFYTEYGGPIISVKTVDSLGEAIEHINEHSTKHSECIITENMENATEFLNKIDSSCVYLNASTRFSDGFVFGLGAEIGISTQKLHARGPMGLEALVTTKYFVTGNGATRK